MNIVGPWWGSNAFFNELTCHSVHNDRPLINIEIHCQLYFNLWCAFFGDCGWHELVIMLRKAVCQPTCYISLRYRVNYLGQSQLHHASSTPPHTQPSIYIWRYVYHWVNERDNNYIFKNVLQMSLSSLSFAFYLLFVFFSDSPHISLSHSCHLPPHPTPTPSCLYLWISQLPWILAISIILHTWLTFKREDAREWERGQTGTSCHSNKKKWARESQTMS